MEEEGWYYHNAMLHEGVLYHPECFKDLEKNGGMDSSMDTTADSVMDNTADSAMDTSNGAIKDPAMDVEEMTPMVADVKLEQPEQSDEESKPSSNEIAETPINVKAEDPEPLEPENKTESAESVEAEPNTENSEDSSEEVKKEPKEVQVISYIKLPCIPILFSICLIPQLFILLLIMNILLVKRNRAGSYSDVKSILSMELSVSRGIIFSIVLLLLLIPFTQGEVFVDVVHMILLGIVSVFHKIVLHKTMNLDLDGQESMMMIMMMMMMMMLVDRSQQMENEKELKT